MAGEQKGILFKHVLEGYTLKTKITAKHPENIFNNKYVTEHKVLI